MDELDVPTGRGGELCEILTVDGHDLVPIGGEEHDARVDDISEPGGGEEPACGPPERFVKGADVDAGKCLGKASLVRATPRHLAEDTCVGQREIACQVGSLQSQPHRPFVALDRHEGAAVKYEAHADLALRVVC